MNNAEVLKDFLVRLGFEVDETSMTKFSEGILSSTTRIMAFGAAMTAAAAGVIHSVKEIANENRELALLAQQLNTTTSAVDDFIDTADMLGVSNDIATESLKSFSRSVADAQMGVGRSKVIFEKLHIAVKDANGQLRSSTEVMADLQSKMQGMGRAQQLRVMERLGLDPKMLVMFNDEFGKTAYIGKELSNIDAAAGFNLDKAVAQSQEFTATWKDMSVEINLIKMLFSKMYETVAINVMPAIQVGIKKVTQAITDARHWIMDNAQQIEGALKPIIDVTLRIGSAFVQMATTAFKLVMDIVSPIVTFLMKINDATDGWAGYIVAAMVAWRAFNLAFLATPLGMLLALGVGIIALIDDFQTFEAGGKSFFSFWGKLAPYIHGAINLFKQFASFVSNSITSVIKVVYDLISAITKLMGMGLDKVAEFFGSIFGGSKTISTTHIAPSGAKGGANVNQQTVINVNGAGNPQAVAAAVHSNQHNVNQQMARNMRGAVR